jgi:hypothetical protein
MELIMTSIRLSYRMRWCRTLMMLMTPPLRLDADRPSSFRSHPICLGEYVAHLSEYPNVFVTTCCDFDHGKAPENTF